MQCFTVTPSEDGKTTVFTAACAASGLVQRGVPMTIKRFFRKYPLLQDQGALMHVHISNEQVAGVDVHGKK